MDQDFSKTTGVREHDQMRTLIEWALQTREVTDDELSAALGHIGAERGFYLLGRLFYRAALERHLCDLKGRRAVLVARVRAMLGPVQ
jgi:hypothetical protein